MDVSQFNTLTVDPVNEEDIVGAGNTLGELYDALANMECHLCQKSVYRNICKCDAYIYKCEATFIYVRAMHL